MNIYELEQSISAIDAQLDEIDALLIETGGEITEEIEALQLSLSEERDALLNAIAGKAEDAIKWYKNTYGELTMARQMKREVDQKRSSREKRLEYIKSLIIDAMNIQGVNKMKAGVFSCSVRDTVSTEVDTTTVIAPYKERIIEFCKTLPPYITLDVKVLPSAIDESEPLPAGITKVTKQSLTIR